MRYTDIESEISKRYEPIVKYLIQNHGNPNKINSNLDMAWENIHEIDALIQQLNNYRRDLDSLKKIVEDLSKQQDKGDERI